MTTYGAMIRCVGVFILLCALGAQADELENEADFSLSAPLIQEILNPAASLQDYTPNTYEEALPEEPPRLEEPTIWDNLEGSAESSSQSLSQLILLGQQLWQLLEAGRPHSTFQSDLQKETAQIIPAGIKNWTELQGWKTPKSHTYEVSYKNSFGKPVIHFAYRILFTPGGNLGGIGRYLTNVRVIPESIQLSYGYSMDAQAHILTVTNAGTTQDPIAAAELLVSWKVNTIMSHSEGSSSFYIRADGKFTEL